MDEKSRNQVMFYVFEKLLKRTEVAKVLDFIEETKLDCIEGTKLDQRLLVLYDFIFADASHSNTHVCLL